MMFKTLHGKIPAWFSTLLFYHHMHRWSHPSLVSVHSHHRSMHELYSDNTGFLHPYLVNHHLPFRSQFQSPFLMDAQPDIMVCMSSLCDLLFLNRATLCCKYTHILLSVSLPMRVSSMRVRTMFIVLVLLLLVVDFSPPYSSK